MGASSQLEWLFYLASLGHLFFSGVCTAPYVVFLGVPSGTQWVATLVGVPSALFVPSSSPHGLLALVGVQALQCPAPCTGGVCIRLL